MEVIETLLPGVGIRYEFILESGYRAGLVLRRDGRVDVLGYDPRDPDVSTEVMTLSRAEAETFADLLGGPRFAERFADLSREVPGLMAADLEIPAGSRYANGTLGHTRARSLTGASIVAVVRGEEVIASPVPSQQLLAGDVLVVIGTEQAIAAIQSMLAETSG